MRKYNLNIFGIANDVFESNLPKNGYQVIFK